MLQSSVSCDMLVLCFMFLFYVIITNTMAYWYDGAALAATRSPVIALFWCLIKFTTTTTTTMRDRASLVVEKAKYRLVHSHECKEMKAHTRVAKLSGKPFHERQNVMKRRRQKIETVT